MENSEKKMLLDKSDEIDLALIFYKIWQGKFIILIIMILAFSIGIYHLNNQPKIFTARSVFGFSNTSTNGNIIPQEFSFLTNYNNIDSNEDTITQIKGKDFLRKIIIKIKSIGETKIFKIIQSRR